MQRSQLPHRTPRLSVSRSGAAGPMEMSADTRRGPHRRRAAAVTITVVGVLAGWVPAYRASRLDPARALTAQLHNRPHALRLRGVVSAAGQEGRQRGGGRRQSCGKHTPGELPRQSTSRCRESEYAAGSRPNRGRDQQPPVASPWPARWQCSRPLAARPRCCAEGPEHRGAGRARGGPAAGWRRRNSSSTAIARRRQEPRTLCSERHTDQARSRPTNSTNKSGRSRSGKWPTPGNKMNRACGMASIAARGSLST